MENTKQAGHAIKLCKYCKSEISKEAKICPHCRKRVALGTVGKALAIILGIVVLTAIFNSVSDNSQQNTTTPALSQSDIKQIGNNVDAWKKTPAGQLCATHDKFSRQDCDLIVAHKVNVGMSYDALVYMRGKPDTVNPSNYGGVTKYQYCWTGRTPTCFYDDNGDGIMDAFN